MHVKGRAVRNKCVAIPDDAAMSNGYLATRWCVQLNRTFPFPLHDLITCLGRLERCYTARHALGLYRSVIVTCRYTLGTSSSEIRQLDNLLYSALALVITHHPALCCSIIGEESENPVVRRLQSIDLRNLVSLVQLDEVDHLVHHLEKLHDETWTKLDQRPAWKVVVFRPPGGTLNNEIDIAFIFHHALADGLSGAAFHSALLQELRHATSLDQEALDAPKVIQVPRNIRLTDPLEDSIKLSLSWSFLTSQLLQEFGPRWLCGPRATTLWAGARCKTLEECPYKTRLRVLSIPAVRVEDWLNAARREKVTLTSFITATIVVTLASLLPEAERFVGVTPYTMRRFCGTSMDAIVNQTSGFNTPYDHNLLNQIRVSSQSSPDRDSQIWKVAHYFHSEMKAELGRCPKDNLIGLLPYIPSYQQFYEKKLGQTREATFEVSNLGKLELPIDGGHQTENKDGWTIGSILFSQGPQVVGPAFTVNCASVSGGSLNLVFGWQDGVVAESVIDAIVRDFESSATST